MVGNACSLVVGAILDFRKEAMRHIALIAPGVAPPLTEGRKLFVIDLAEALRRKGLDVDVVSGEPHVSGLRGIWNSLRQLERYCTAHPKIDAAVVFPYGTFTGLRRVANRWFLKKSLSIARRNGIAVLPVFYSSEGLSIEEIGTEFAPALAVGRSGGGVGALHLGISKEIPARAPREGGLRDLLFLCGYQNPTPSALNDVLHGRGLIDLLRAGNALADAGQRLTIAIPFLNDPVMQEKVRKLVSEICPNLPVFLRDSIDPSNVFNEYDAFLFPYRTPHAVFVPTSLLEAMSSGIPVIAADHAMYRALTSNRGVPRCRLHRIGDPEDLASQVLAMKDQYRETVRQSAAEVSLIRKEWNIDVSACELMDALHSLIHAPR